MIVHSRKPQLHLTMKSWHAVAEGAMKSCDGEGGAVRCSGEVLCDEVSTCDGDSYGCAGNHYCLTHRTSAEAYWRNTRDSFYQHLTTPGLLHTRYLIGLLVRSGDFRAAYEIASLNRVLTLRTSSIHASRSCQRGVHHSTTVHHTCKGA